MISTITSGTSIEESISDSNNKIEKIIDIIPVNQEVKKIDDILSFKIGQSLYPLSKPFKEFPRKGVRSSKL